MQEVWRPVLSPEDFVPNGHECVGVEGTDEYEQQQVQTHHDGKMVSEEPGGAARTSEERQRYEPKPTSPRDLVTWTEACDQAAVKLRDFYLDRCLLWE